MAPKKGKDLTANEDYWRTSIEEAQLNEENWTVKVIIIEASGSDQDRIYLSKFESFAAEEKRFVIKNICKTETTLMINQLGAEKKVKDDNLRVFEEGQAYLKDKKDIPPDILALIMKNLVLKMKQEYIFIKRQRLEVREGIRNESTTMIDRNEIRGTVGASVKQLEVVETEPPPKAKGKKAEPAPALSLEPDVGKKYNTQLRLRGEEWRDKVYVDDFPIDGPNLYVAITGFVEPLLAGCLVKIGVPVTAIVKISIDTFSTRVPSSLTRQTKRGQSQTEILTEKSQKFWEDLQQLRISRDTANSFKDTAFIAFSPPYSDCDNLSGSPDKIYDEICYLMYDIQDLTRQHIHYLENMDIIYLPEETIDEKYFRCYHQYPVYDIPLECITIFSVVDSILQTVEENQIKETESSACLLPNSPYMNQHEKQTEESAKLSKAVALVNDVLSQLCKADTNKKSYRTTYGDELENNKDPMIINYGDIAQYTTFQLGNINLHNIVWTALSGMPVNILWQNHKRPEAELEAKIAFHVNVLLSCFERKDVETAELTRLMHILSCRKLYNNRSSLNKKHLPFSTIKEFKNVYLKRSVLAEPLQKIKSITKQSSMTSSFPSITKCEDVLLNAFDENDPKISKTKLLFDCPDISELVSADEIASDRPINHMIDDFEHFEDFSGINALQIMLEAFNQFNCVDYKYCVVTDSIILMFFNSHDNDGVAREEWRCHIPTPLCLQDFFDFVLEENYEWIQNEEKKYDETIIPQGQSECAISVGPSQVKSCVENEEVDSELIMEGSLKHKDIIVDAEDESKQTLESSVVTSKKTTLSPTSTEPDSKYSKKGKSPNSTVKSTRRSFTMSSASAEVIKKPFSGYNLGNRRVEVFGQNSTYFSKDGTKVISKYMLTIPTNLEYLILNVVPGNGANEFWFHRALGEDVPSDIVDKCESFRITTKDRVTINLRKQTYKSPLPIVSMSYIENSKVKESEKSTNSNIEHNIHEIKHFHTLYLTWPNGLITESVHIDNASDISHIKQYYINPVPHLNEEMRCISLKGEVILFRPSGIIEVLKPDGTVIKITKCEKRAVETENIGDVLSDISSDKGKKVKSKDKPSKASSKSSKNETVEDEIKPIEYELFIEEYETIDSNGLRQKWINEIPHVIEKMLIRTATDYCLREVFSRRMDGTNILLNSNGVQVVTFPDKTRITTRYFLDDEEIYPYWTEEEKEYFGIYDADNADTETIKSKVSFSQKSYVESCSETAVNSIHINTEEEIIEKKRNDGYISVHLIYTIEHENFTTVTINQLNGEIAIDSPNGTKVVMGQFNNYEFILDSTMTAKFDGKYLNLNYEACSECQSNTTAIIRIKPDEMSSVTKIHQHWLRMKDSFCKNIVVNEEGHVSIVEESSGMLHHEENEHQDESANVKEKSDIKTESYFAFHGKCRDLYLAKAIRFFVLGRELSCSELVHKMLLEQYKRVCRWQPWCSIEEYDTFGDHRSLLSVLSPVHLTETEKWLMDSKLANKPEYLSYRDLKKDTGKGFYHWMRPYDRFYPKPMKPDNVIPPRLPRAFILRTLERQWKESDKQQLSGAKELLAAVLRYRRVMESDVEAILHVPIKDSRSAEEKHADHDIQAIGHRVYEDLRTRLAADVEGRAKLNITVKPAPDMSMNGELEEELSEEDKTLEAEREILLKEVEAAQEISPNLNRYWRRRAEEFKEEQFYKYLLREGSVPPYFRNVLGGAIWWEINSAAGRAVAADEGPEVKCACEEYTSNTGDTGS